MKMRNRMTWILSAGFVLLIFATTATAQNASASKKHKPVSPPLGTVPDDMSPEAAEVVWMHHHNATSDSILHYVNSSHADFKLSVRDVNYLKDIGVSTDIVFAMIRTPEARENVVRLKNHEPQWRVSKKAKKEPKAPKNALQNSEALTTEVTDINYQQNAVPNYYGPTLRGPAHRIPQGQYYGVPAPGYVPAPGNTAPVPNGGFDYRYQRQPVPQ